jgi:pimeloyl-ACP methyl ester carboxylesterase
VSENIINSRQEIIVVVHGLGSSKAWMVPLCKKLCGRGYRVENWGYRSFAKSIDFHAVQLNQFVDDLPKEITVHFVAHSMGAIVVRAALDRRPLPNLGRIVFLAPPNLGSPLARYATKIVGSFCKSICQLSDRPDSFVNQIRSVPATEFGVVAARYDFLVPRASTGLEGMSDRVTVNALHSSLLFSQRTADLTISFIETGRFEVCQAIDSTNGQTGSSAKAV